MRITYARIWSYLSLSVLTILFLGCGTIQTKNEVEVKPMHITIDVNVKIQQELKDKFKTADDLSKEISNKEAEDALNRYLESQKTSNNK